MKTGIERQKSSERRSSDEQEYIAQNEESGKPATIPTPKKDIPAQSRERRRLYPEKDKAVDHPTVGV